MGGVIRRSRGLQRDGMFRSERMGRNGENRPESVSLGGLVLCGLWVSWLVWRVAVRGDNGTGVEETRLYVGRVRSIGRFVLPIMLVRFSCGE